MMYTQKMPLNYDKLDSKSPHKQKAHLNSVMDGYKVPSVNSSLGMGRFRSAQYMA